MIADVVEVAVVQEVRDYGLQSPIGREEDTRMLQRIRRRQKLKPGVANRQKM